MLGIFEKKVLLKEQIDGFIDIHNHLLPGIDDGAANVDESVALVEHFKSLGISNFISTPHVMNDYYPNTPKSINGALQELKTAVKERGISGVQFHAAAEYMMDHAFMKLIEEGELLTLHKDMVLVEMSYFQPPINLNEILFELQAKGYKPVLAHPERYAFFHSKNLAKYEELKKRGCYFQLNILSLLGHYGKHIQESAFLLLDRGMIDFAGTDTHQVKHVEKLASAKLPKKRIKQLEPILRKTADIFSAAFS